MCCSSISAMIDGRQTASQTSWNGGKWVLAVQRSTARPVAIWLSHSLVESQCKYVFAAFFPYTGEESNAAYSRAATNRTMRTGQLRRSNKTRRVDSMDEVTGAMGYPAKAG